MNQRMTNSGLAGGGVITIRQVIANRNIFQAVMEWPNDPVKISSGISTTAAGCLESLEEKLSADYAAKSEKE
jgi:hypothetical protein